MKSFSHSEQIITDFPNNYTGIIPYVKLTNLDELIKKKEKIINKIQESNIYIENAENMSRIWQDIFKKIGAKPKYKSSITSLLDCYKEKNNLWEISPVVDFYNYLSLLIGCPMAAYDTTKIGDNFELRYARKGEPFTPLTNPKQIEKSKNQEVIYTDGDKIICRYWNLQDCYETKISTETNLVTFMFDIYAENATQAEELMQSVKNNWFDDFDCEINSFLTGANMVNEINF